MSSVVLSGILVLSSITPSLGAAVQESQNNFENNLEHTVIAALPIRPVIKGKGKKGARKIGKRARQTEQKQDASAPQSATDFAREMDHLFPDNMDPQATHDAIENLFRNSKYK